MLLVFMMLQEKMNKVESSSSGYQSGECLPDEHNDVSNKDNKLKFVPGFQPSSVPLKAQQNAAGHVLIQTGHSDTEGMILINS